MVTIYKDFYSKEARHVALEYALDRIKSGKSKEAITALRNLKTKEDMDKAKKRLPCVCFSGKFGASHTDASLEKHSGYLVLDFDDVEDMAKKREALESWPHTYACWVSPRGTGLKVLIKIANGEKHREHFDALKPIFPEMDMKCRNPSRLCFESYDPDLTINEHAIAWTKIATTEVVSQSNVTTDDYDIFNKLLTWLTSRGNGFKSGERNEFVFKLASACCRYGIMEETAQSIIGGYAQQDGTFTQKECRAAVRSGYRSSAKDWNTAEFSNDRLVTKNTTREVKIELTHEEVEELTTQNVTRGKDVKSLAIDFYDSGYKKVFGIGIPEIDKYFKRMEGELTVLTGFGNYGKSSFWTWWQLMRAIIYDEKMAMFSPESSPAEMFYHDITEMYLGCDCTPFNKKRPSREAYSRAYDWVSEHFFNVEPKKLAPTPELIKETFLSLIITEGVKAVIVDPFNQMANDYNSSGGRTDKYLETFLSECSRFAKMNSIYFDIVAHPKTPKSKGDDGNYETPDVFDISEGSMWNNKADNILVYHRPFAQTNPTAPECDFISKKIRRQKIVGEKGMVSFHYDRDKRRFIVGGIDYMELAIAEKNKVVQQEIFEPPAVSALRPNINFASSQDIKESHSPYESDELDGKNYK